MTYIPVPGGIPGQPFSDGTEFACCLRDSTDYKMDNVLTYQMQCIIECFIDDYFNKAVRDECFGKSSGVDKWYKEMSDLYLMKHYLVKVIFREIMDSRICEYVKNNYTVTGGTFPFKNNTDFPCIDNSEWRTTFNIDCMIDYFKCRGINVEHIIQKLKYFIELKGIGCLMVSSGYKDVVDETEDTIVQCDDPELFSIG